MRSVDMAVVVSAENDEDKKFDDRGLDIRLHRQRMETIDENGRDVEAQFKDPEHPLQLVFVCAMWLTGFDAPTVSSLYLDKPQKDHTLMQTIARANRVTSYRINGVEKKNGEIVDYYGVLGRLKKAIADYGQSAEGVDEPPVKDKAELHTLLQSAIKQGEDFCMEREVDLRAIREVDDVFGKVGLFESWADRLLSRDDWRKGFRVHANLIDSLYEACKPEILGKPMVRQVAVFQYLNGVINSLVEQQDVDSAIRRVNDLLDESVVVDAEQFKGSRQTEAKYQIRQKGQTWDLSRIDFDKLREEFKQAKYKNIEIADLRAFIEHKLKEMLDQNRTRQDFAERFQAIIDRYNSGSSTVEADYEALLDHMKSLKEESERHIRLGLSEDELEIFDLLRKDKMTKAEEEKVKLASRALLKRLTQGKPIVLVQDWYRDTQTRQTVRDEVEAVLDQHLPEDSYNKDIFLEKRDRLFDLTLNLAINHRKWAAAPRLEA